MLYWELGEFFVQTLSGATITVRATPLGESCLRKVPPEEFTATLLLGGTQPLHDCWVKVKPSSIYVWHKDEPQPPIRLEENELREKISSLRPSHGVTVDRPYEFIGMDQGLIRVLDYSTEPTLLIGVAAFPLDLMPIVWALNSYFAVSAHRTLEHWVRRFYWLHFPTKEPPLKIEVNSEEEESDTSRPSWAIPGPFLDELLTLGPVFSKLIHPVEAELAEVVWEGLAELKGLTITEARAEYPVISYVSSCPWTGNQLPAPAENEANADIEPESFVEFLTKSLPQRRAERPSEDR